MNQKDYNHHEAGAVIIEAAIYVPIAICIAITMIYLGLFVLQESLFVYEVQRLTIYASKEAGNIGYSKFDVATDNDFEFEYSGDAPSKETVKSYYEAYHEDLGSLYRGVAGIINASEYNDYRNEIEEMVQHGLMFGFTVSPSVEVEKGLLGTKIIAKITYSIPTPGAMRYLGLDQICTFQTASYCHVTNPAEFVRNTDLAVDLVEFVAEALNLDGELDQIINKAKEIINVLL